jgi:choline-sulfatase
MPENPNFLIIMSDQHAPDALGGLGHPAVKTPVLDSLMARGITFTSAYCAYPMCTPTRASFMTGKLTPQHGVWELGTPLGPDQPTWAHALRLAGYRTTICGRMHFIGPDVMHGFERRVHPEMQGGRVPYAYGDWDTPQGDDHVMVKAVKRAGPTADGTTYEKYDGGVCNAALQELENIASSGEARPWALTVGFGFPHFPYQVTPEYWDRYEGVEIPMPRTPPDGRSFEDLIPEQVVDSRRALGLTADGISDEEVRTARRCYYGMITCLDEMIGRLVARVGDLGFADNTWIVYLSDHGDNMGEHGLWSKLNFYEDSVRVPFVIAPPAYAQDGSLCRANVSQVDWFPTLLELTGSEGWHEDLPGRSLVPLIGDPHLTWDDRSVVSDYACIGTHVPMRMVRRGRWKGCFAPGFPPVLFDVENDPHEWTDLGSNPAHAELVAELETLARSDGWDPNALRHEIHTHKRRLKFIAQAEDGPQM